jgi:predicted amidophosphoribosyltransferase
MSFRGDIAIVCDSCEGEHYFCAEDFEGSTLESRMAELDWTFHGTGKARQVLCDVCAEDIEEGRRCEKCWTALETGTWCGDCYGGTERDPQARSWESAATPFAENH